MKNFNFLLSLTAILIFSWSVNAQNIVEKDSNMSLGLKNALVIDLEDTNKKTAEKIWKNVMKEYGKTKKQKDEFRNEMVVIPAISNQSVNVHMRLEEMKNLTRAYVWVDTGEYFVNSVDHAEQSESVENLLTTYYREVRKKVIGEEVKDEEDNLKDLSKDLRKLEDKNEDYHKDIEKAKKKITELEQRIQQNLRDQESKRSEIEAQKEVVIGVTDKLNNIGKGM